MWKHHSNIEEGEKNRKKLHQREKKPNKYHKTLTSTLYPYLHFNCAVGDSHIISVAIEREALGLMQWNALRCHLALPELSNEVMITVQGCVEIPQLDCISYFFGGQRGCDG